MKYAISSITDPLDRNVVNAPEIGAESRVSVSYDPWSYIGKVSQPLVASGVFTQDAAYIAPVDGLDMQVIAETPLRSVAPIVLLFAAIFADNTTGTATATFDNQGYFEDQSNNFGQGKAIDLVPSAPKKIKTLSFTSVTGGATGNRYMIVALPEKESYIPIRCKVEANLTPPFAKSKSVASGYKGSAFVKKARSEEGKATISAKHFSIGDGLTRLAGQAVTLLLETYKDDLVLDQRSVLSNWRPTPVAPRGEGDDDVQASAEGMFSDFALFS